MIQSFFLSRKLLSLFFIGLVVICSSCKEPNYPRPRGYPRMILPETQYTKFDHEGCPFTFDYPKNGVLDKRRIDSCFFNIDFPQYRCKWHFTTRMFNRPGVNYHTSLEDYREVIYRHTQKGTIDETVLKYPNGRGVFFELYGEVPTSADYFFSDSTRYAVIASFYFETAVKNDSLAPIISLMKKDLRQTLKTFRWK